MTNRSIFYGWWVVAAFCVTTFISTGIRHAVGPFLKPIVADLNLDRASFSLVIAVSLFLYGVFMPLAGMALDRFSVRVVTSERARSPASRCLAWCTPTGSSWSSTACWSRWGWPGPAR
jgi:MFS family permease